jgi:hypothetical protein
MKRKLVSYDLMDKESYIGWTSEAKDGKEKDKWKLYRNTW